MLENTQIGKKQDLPVSVHSCHPDLVQFLKINALVVTVSKGLR